ncbi:MAG: hypothetical protein IJ071_04415, partial [Ruminococcus sp.]|nr:hypothetical protein [Ruminococcus sp.]
MYDKPPGERCSPLPPYISTPAGPEGPAKDSQKPAGWGVREKRVQRGKPKRGEGRRLLYQFFVKALP